MRLPLHTIIVLCLAMSSFRAAAAEPAPVTSLDNPTVQYRVLKSPYVVLKRADVEAVVVDNQAVDDAVLPRHRAGYNGIASLKHTKRPENLFVPEYAGLNYEHMLHETVPVGGSWGNFEPRRAPMELRSIDAFTVELYQKPTPVHGLESCTRFQLLDDGTIEMTFECIPRQRSFPNGYMCLIWASYIQKPESRDIHLKGYPADQPSAVRWIQGAAGPDSSTYVGADDRCKFAPHGLSDYRYQEPWYFGVSHGMALVQLFRPNDQIRIIQVAGGAGPGNPAWDFEYNVLDYEVGKRYQLVMRAMYLPYESPEQIARAVQPHWKALAGPVHHEEPQADRH